MTFGLSCAYCGAKNATRRLPGDPPTCATCKDLPAAERAVELDAGDALSSYYNGTGPSERAESLPTLES